MEEQIQRMFVISFVLGLKEKKLTQAILKVQYSLKIPT